MDSLEDERIGLELKLKELQMFIKLQTNLAVAMLTCLLACFAAMCMMFFTPYVVLFVLSAIGFGWVMHERDKDVRKYRSWQERLVQVQAQKHRVDRIRPRR